MSKVSEQTNKQTRLRTNTQTYREAYRTLVSGQALLPRHSKHNVKIGCGGLAEQNSQRIINFFSAVFQHSIHVNRHHRPVEHRYPLAGDDLDIGLQAFQLATFLNQV